MTRTALAAEPRVLHHIPGRMRVHLAAWSGEHPQTIEQRLGQCEGVRSVKANPATKNVLVVFNENAVGARAVLEKIAEVHSRRPIREGELTLVPIGNAASDGAAGGLVIIGEGTRPAARLAAGCRVTSNSRPPSSRGGIKSILAVIVTLWEIPFVRGRVLKLAGSAAIDLLRSVSGPINIVLGCIELAVLLASIIRAVVPLTLQPVSA